jgi:type I restriction-modification system DNA methylase subunit
MPECPDIVKRLVERFNQQSDTVTSASYNETNLRVDYINPFMRALGWDVDNSKGYAEQYREVVHEDRVKVAGQTKAPDYSFRIGGQRKFFLEAKKPAVNIKKNKEPAYQLRRYAWSAKLACSILTDFEEFAIYDTRVRPKQFDKAAEARRDYIRYTEYEDRWDFIYGTFSQEAVLRGDFDRYCGSKKGRGAEEFDDAFLAEIEEWRLRLANCIARLNEELDQSSLNFAVQRIIDRIIFLRIAEDRGTEPQNQLKDIFGHSDYYRELVSLFNRADERYNSGLFHFKKEKDREEAPDTLTRSLKVDNKTLQSIIEGLYYPQSPYEFSVVSADILGSVYERFLGKVIELTPSHRAKVVEKPEVRKAGGVYYTPPYIVDYIVKNTVGELLKKKAVPQARKIKVLDPACGSGSFLIGAYQHLLDWYLEQHTSEDPEKKAGQRDAVIRPGPAGGWMLTSSERKRILLDHIYGVDIDAQAVEVTKLNLLLKCLEGETSETLGFTGAALFHKNRALPDLGQNIQCGNSLIGTDIIGTEAWEEMDDDERARINPFDYKRAFPAAFAGKKSGFHAVIGNPPYIQLSMENFYSEPIDTYISKNFSSSMGRANTFGLFISITSRQLTRAGGSYSYIIPNTILSQDYYENLRRIILSDHISSISAYNYHVFSDAIVEPVVITAWKRTPNNEPIPVYIWTAPNTLSKNHTIDRLPISDNPTAHISINASRKDQSIAKKMQEAGVNFSTCANINQAIALKGDRSLSLTDAPGSNGVRVLDGREINKYSISWSGTYLQYDINRIHSCKRRDIFDRKEKLFFRRVGESLIATYDDSQFYALNTLVVLTPKEIFSGDLKAILGWFNSTLVNWYYTKFLKSSKRTFSEIQARQIGRIPFPILITEQSVHQDNLVKAVKRRLELQRRVDSELNPIQIDKIQREIDTTDHYIDQIVYELYGLTEDEIHLVEETSA